MDYVALRKAWFKRDSYLSEHNGADGTSSDNSTDPIITRNPNDYVLPKIGSITLIHSLTVAIGVLAVIILLPMAIKQVKSYV